MATSHRKQAAPVGSVKWVFDERKQAQEWISQEVEEFSFAARNEMEWLNEHMADVFTQNRMNITEVFKTPGKLRGKTPRTARKQPTTIETREPLTDVFAPTPNRPANPTPNNAFYKQVSKFQIAEDQENATQPSENYSQATTAAGCSQINDSGFHDMADDATVVNTQDSSVDIQALPPVSPEKPENLKSISVHPSPQRSPIKSPRQRSPSRRLSEESFVSANENFRGRTPMPFEEPAVQKSPARTHVITTIPENPVVALSATVENTNDPIVQNEVTDMEMIDVDVDYPALPVESQVSTEQQSGQLANDTPVSTAAPSPERGFLRKKSSFSFASLPAREPLGKKSMGTRNSRVSHFDETQDGDFSIHEDDDILDDTINAKGQHETDNKAADAMDVAETEEAVKSVPLNENKTSTQRLHERITLLGMQSQSRQSKSMAASAPSVNQQSIPSVSKRTDSIDTTEPQSFEANPKSNRSSSFKSIVVDIVHENGQPTLLNRSSYKSSKPDASSEADSKSAVSGVPSSPVRHQSPTRSRPTSPIKGATTSRNQITSPVVNRFAEGPLSASKARLYSVFKTAKDMFTSTATLVEKPPTASNPPNSARPSSAQPKKAVPTSMQSKEQEIVPQNIAQMANEQDEEKPVRRSSARLEQQRKEAAQKAESEQGETAKQAHNQTSSALGPSAMEVDQPQASAKVSHNTSTLFKPTGEPRRPLKVTKESAKADGNKPQAVSIKVGSQRIANKGPQSTGSLNSEASTTSMASTRPTLHKKTSSQSIKGVTSSQSMKGVKALEAAARRREQEEREARRRAEQRREVEKRRAATRAEEEEKAVQEKRAADQRARQAQEQRRAEATRKLEQIRSQQSSQERGTTPSAPPTLQRQDTAGSIRPVSRMGNPTGENMRPAVPHINPVKPPKRYWNPDDEQQHEERGATAGRSTANYTSEQQSKRRRTSEMSRLDEPQTQAQQAPQRPQMAPPVRLSGLRKEPPSKFTHGFMSQNAGPSNHQTMLKTAVNAQHHLQHPKTPHNISQYAQNRIPFAEAPNPPQTGQSRPNTAHGKTPGKTPARTPGTGHKSSPHFPNGDNISLPEIATDDEDSDAEDNGFIPPDWANSPALRDLLSKQQLVDPVDVFGPIGPLSMEEIFKGNKERLAKFRNRTSSANWAGADRLTEEERRKDFEAREKLERAGGWNFRDAV